MVLHKRRIWLIVLMFVGIVMMIVPCVVYGQDPTVTKHPAGHWVTQSLDK